MPTVIDELVVTLGLDTKNFNQSQRDAVEQLRQFQSVVARTAKQSTSDFAEFQAAITAINHPIAALKQALTHIASGAHSVSHATQTTWTNAQQAGSQLQAMAHRSGTAVRASGDNAAQGFMALARAGLVAFAAVELVSKSMKDVYDTTMKLNGIQTAAYAANMNPRRFAALENVFSEQSGGIISSGETANFLSNFEIQRQGFRVAGNSSQFAGTMTAAARFLGIGAGELMNMSQEEFLRRFAAAAQGPNGAQASYIGSQLGMSPAMVKALHDMGPQGFQRALGDAASRAPSDREVNNAHDLAIEFAKLGDWMEKLKYDLLDDATPAIISFTESLEDMAKWLDDHRDIIWQWIKTIFGFSLTGGLGVDSLGSAAPVTSTGTTNWLGSAYNWVRGKLGLSPIGGPSSSNAGPPAGSGNLPNNVQAPAQYAGMIAGSAAKWNVPPEIMTRMIGAESGFNPNATSPTGAHGLAQFIRSTAALYGVDRNDPASSIEGMAHYLHDLYKKHGNWGGAIDEYLGSKAAYDPSYRKWGVPQYAQQLDSGQVMSHSNGGMEVWGDSRAVGIHNHLGGGGYQHGGDTPSTILAKMQSMPPGYFKGKNIILDSGTNGNEMGTVDQTIGWLKQQGANVSVVGYGWKYSAKDSQLQAMAKQHGVPYIAAGANDGTHDSPGGYADELRRATLSFGGGGNVANHSVTTGDIHVHATSDNPYAIGGAVQNAITRSTATSADYGTSG